MQARGIPCPRCGGIFPVTDLAREVHCPYCAHRFALSREAIAELDRYQRAVHSALGHADSEHEKAAAWNASAEAMSNSWVGLAAFGVLLALLVIGAFALQAALMAGVLSQDVIPVLSTVMVIGVFVITIGLSTWLTIRARRPAQTASAGAARVACPSCGAPNQLDAGRKLETCRFCRAALVPSRTVMVQAMDAAHAARRAAEIQRYRAERKGMVAAMSRSFAGATPYIVLGSFLPITGGSALVMTGQLLAGDRPPPLAAIAAIGGLASLNVALIALVYTWRSNRKQRVEAALTALARQFGGTLLPGLPGVALWLDAYWAAPYDHKHVCSGPYHAAARLDAGGYAALIDVDPVSSMPNYYPPRVHLILAAAVPEHAPPAASAAVHASRAWLEQAGFTLEIQPSGLLARAQGTTLTRLRKNPESLHVLSTVLTTLVGLARGLGAEPVAPSP
jgi:hypothetical protein